MIFTLISIGLIVLGFLFLLIASQKSSWDEDGWIMTGAILLVIGGILILCCFVAWSGKEMCANAYVVKYEAVQKTVDDARNNENITQFELAAIQQKAVEKNEHLAGLKYWAEHPLCNWFYSKKILQIQPIR